MFLQGKVLFDFEEVFSAVFLENENVCVCVWNSDSLLIVKFLFYNGRYIDCLSLTYAT